MVYMVDLFALFKRAPKFLCPYATMNERTSAFYFARHITAFVLSRKWHYFSFNGLTRHSVRHLNRFVNL
jgi:hypothetical protein